MYYESYFGLDEGPFSISPDPRFLYLTHQHREALAHLLYGVNGNGGFVLLTGEIGAGKTTLCHCLLNQLPKNADVAYVLNSKLAVHEFIETICDELSIPYDESATLKQLIDAIHRHLLVSHSSGRNTILLVDEAQNLSIEVIEQIRLLSNLETSKKKLLQIILIGQPELRAQLALPELKQMAQRITARFHLGTLSKKEIADYVAHRMRIAGAHREIFTPQAVRTLWQYTRGVPRLINVICDRSLLGAYVGNQEKVDADILSSAATEVLGIKAHQANWLQRVGWGVAAIVIGTVAFTASYYYQGYLQQTATEKNLAPITAIVPDTKASEEPIPLDNDHSPVIENTLSENINSDTEPTLPTTPDEPILAADFIEILMQSNGALQQAAFEALAAQWGSTYLPQAGQNPCDYMAEQQLACLWRQGNLSSLVDLNRPALLTLYDDSGRSFPVTLLHVDTQNAYLQAGGKEMTIPLAALDQWWYGQHMVLWRIPTGYQSPLREGSSGKAVKWLLNLLEKESAVNLDQAIYNSELSDQIKQFQRQYGLIPDGIVGPLTIIALNNLWDDSAPQLVKKNTTNEDSE